MNQYSVDAKDMISVADTIREKANITEQLSFPEGWEDAIRGIKTGVGLNFEVVGGTTQPENPKENTIWVNTDQEITGWSFSVTEPTAPVPGMVWFCTGSNSSVAFNALKEEEIRVCSVHALQYISGVWEKMSVKSYRSGAWAEWYLYLYDHGDTFNAVTGGFNSTGKVLSDNSPTVATISATYTDNYMEFKITSNEGCAIAHTRNKINLSDYDVLKCNALLGVYIAENAFCRICIWSEIGTYARDNIVAQYKFDNTEGIKEIPIDLAGEYYVGFMLYRYNTLSAPYAKVYSMWLE